MGHGRRSLAGRKGGMVLEHIKIPYRRHGRTGQRERLFLESQVWCWRDRLNPQPHIPPMSRRFVSTWYLPRRERLQIRLQELVRSLPHCLRPAQRAALARRRGRRR